MATVATAIPAPPLKQAHGLRLTWHNTRNGKSRRTAPLDRLDFDGNR